VFDNHGNCFAKSQIGVSPLGKVTRFYQKLSGSISPELFRILSSPPQDEFSFKFFVYSLVESCLTNVLVVDERLAMALLEGRGYSQTNENFSSDLLEHQNAGIYPVFRLRHHQDPIINDEIGFYTENHRDRLANIVRRYRSNDDTDKILAEEGVVFVINNSPKERTKSSVKVLNPIILDATVRPNVLQEQFDVILIHEGAMDILVANGVDWKEVEDRERNAIQLQSLYRLVPIIIRTSGRGRMSKLLGTHLPFIEFTQVSSALLTARNKFSLVRALLGSFGTKVQPD
jgi:hypothetical protein